jgi:hypothetical protein
MDDLTPLEDEGFLRLPDDDVNPNESWDETKKVNEKLEVLACMALAIIPAPYNPYRPFIRALAPRTYEHEWQRPFYLPSVAPYLLESAYVYPWRNALMWSRNVVIINGNLFTWNTVFGIFNSMLSAGSIASMCGPNMALPMPVSGVGPIPDVLDCGFPMTRRVQPLAHPKAMVEGPREDVFEVKAGAVPVADASILVPQLNPEKVGISSVKGMGARLMSCFRQLQNDDFSVSSPSSSITQASSQIVEASICSRLLCSALVDSRNSHLLLMPLKQALLRLPAKIL